MEDFTLVTLIAFLFSAIIIIVFFRLAYNIGIIKKILYYQRLDEVRIKRNLKEGKEWECPNCKKINQADRSDCRFCDYEMFY